MSTYATMRARIANELNKTGLTSEINNAIKSAIAFFEHERFTFNVKTATTTTTSGTEWVEAPDDFIDDVDMMLIDGTEVKVMTKRPDAWITEQGADTDDTDEPHVYAIYGGNIRLFPIPDGAYTLKMRYVYRMDELSADADSNAWLLPKYGEEMVRQRAKWDLCVNVIRTPEVMQEAQQYLAISERIRGRLRDEVRAQESSNTLLPYGL